ncbi:MAG: hypothetical protein MUF87_15240 [Anaerolineae bacterium]|nr:hypothetical protein [Anaerolineae bacterium]
MSDQGLCDSLAVNAFLDNGGTLQSFCHLNDGKRLMRRLFGIVIILFSSVMIITGIIVQVIPMYRSLTQSPERFSQSDVLQTDRGDPYRMITFRADEVIPTHYADPDAGEYYAILRIRDRYVLLASPTPISVKIERYTGRLDHRSMAEIEIMRALAATTPAYQGKFLPVTFNIHPFDPVDGVVLVLSFAFFGWLMVKGIRNFRATDP